MTCDFAYIPAVGEVTAFTFDVATNNVVITGTDLPAYGDISSLQFALAECEINQDTATSGNIECTLSQEPTCGDHKPIITSYLGNIPHADGLASETVLCTISSMHPLDSLNLLGGDNITITGTNFPHNL